MTVKSRIDTPIEVDYYKHGGILPFVLRELIERAGAETATSRLTQFGDGARFIRAPSPI